MAQPVQVGSLVFLPGLPKCGVGYLRASQSHRTITFFCYLRRRLYTLSQTQGQAWESENACPVTLTFSSYFQHLGVIYF